MGHCLISAITQSSIHHCPTVYRPAAIFSFTCQFCLESTSFVVTSAVTKYCFSFSCLYRYFFKTETGERDCAVVWEEVKDDDAELPTYDGKIVGKVEKMDSA